MVTSGMANTAGGSRGGRGGGKKDLETVVTVTPNLYIVFNMHQVLFKELNVS
jgi:hypothetical protein